MALFFFARRQAFAQQTLEEIKNTQGQLDANSFRRGFFPFALEYVMNIFNEEFEYKSELDILFFKGHLVC